MRVLRNFGMVQTIGLLFLFTLFSWTAKAYAYSSITNSENSVTVDVKPVQLSSGQPVKFEVRMNTHSVNLVQDVVGASTLTDAQGHNYQPLSWQGSGPGGHHRRGILEFPALIGSPKSIKLVIKDIANVPQRVFEWKVEK